MKKCRKCKNVFPDTYKYCNICGSKAPAFSLPGSVFISVLKAIAYFCFFEAVQTAVSFLFMAIIWLRAGFGLSVESIPEIMSSLTAQTCLISLVSGVLTVVLLFIFFTARKKNFMKEIGVNRLAGGTIPVIIFMGVALNFFASFTLSFIPLPDNLAEMYDVSYSYIGTGSLLIEFISVVIIAPITEEIIFRALMYKTVKKTAPAWLAAIFSSVIFGIAHLNPISFVYTSLLGLMLIYLYEKTGSVTAPMLLHIGFNLGMYFVGMVPESSPLVYAVILTVSAIAFVLSAAVVIAVNEKNENAL